MQQKQHILLVVPNDSVGGAEGILKMIAMHFKDELVEVKFLTKKNTGFWDSVNPSITLSYSGSGSEYLGAIGFFVKTLFSRKKKYSYIFSSHVFVNGLVGISIKLGLIKKGFFVARESTLIFKRFSGPKLFLYKLMYRLGYSKVDLLICQTVGMKNDLLLNLPYLESKTNLTVIPNPIALIDTNTVNGNEIQNKYGSFIVSAGRLITEKGFDLLIEAFKAIKTEHNELKLLILGEGQKRQELEALVKENNLTDDVLLLGFIHDVLPYFKAAKLCVVSSRVEGFPNVLLQMMSQNNNIVSTKCAGGIDEIEAIYTCEPYDGNDLIKAITEALQSDKNNNRVVFDAFLQSRSISNFISTIKEQVLQN